jgi:hypothetical protein
MNCVGLGLDKPRNRYVGLISDKVRYTPWRGAILKTSFCENILGETPETLVG